MSGNEKPVIIDKVNTGVGTTELDSTNSTTAALCVKNLSSQGSAILGVSANFDGVAGMSDSGTGVSAVGGGPRAIPLIAVGSREQTSNLQEWRHADSAGQVKTLSVVNMHGHLGLGTTLPTAQLHVANDTMEPGSTGIVVDIPGVGTRRILVGRPNSAGKDFRILMVSN